MKFFFIIFFATVCNASDLHVSVQAQNTEKTSVLLAFAGKKSRTDQTMLQRLQKDLQYSGQCKIFIQRVDSVKHFLQSKTRVPDNTYLTVLVSKSSDGYEWSLYDLIDQTMIADNTIFSAGCSATMIAHKIADQVWPALIGKKSSFSSKIAFSKQLWKQSFGRQKPYKQIWISDFDGSNAQLFVDVPTVSFAPRWSLQAGCPLLFYSENTLSNVQLVMSNMFKKRQVMCCFDGLNMQPTFSENGKEVIFCLSKDGSSQLYHSYVDGLSNKRKCERLTHNFGNNIAPCFVDEHHVAFVSDFETTKPQVYIMNVVSGHMKQITDGSYCACPSYCPANNKLIYSKMIDGEMQLFEYNCLQKEHKQLTKGFGSKEEPSWSACGNYVVFGMNEGLKSRIAQLNVITGKIRYLTSENQHCTYPCYSPRYEESLGILKL